MVCFPYKLTVNFQVITALCRVITLLKYYSKNKKLKGKDFWLCLGKEVKFNWKPKKGKKFKSCSCHKIYTVLYFQDPRWKSCLSRKTDCWAYEKPPCGYNNNSLSTNTWAVAVIFWSTQWGNIDICKSAEGIRQGFLPPAVHGLSHAENTRSSVEVC